MKETERTRAILELLSERTSVADLASRFGVAEGEILEWRALYLRGAASTLEAPAPKRRRHPGAWLAAPGVLLLGLSTWVGHARSQGSNCAPMLPAPLTTFCAGTTVSSSEMNGNFAQLVSWLEQKVGPVTQPNVVTAGTANATTLNATTATATTLNSTTANLTNVNATRVSTGALTPPYAGWASQGTGAGGAAIYNDGSGFGMLMLVGNNSRGGVRRIGLWDEVTVNGTLSSFARRSVDGSHSEVSVSTRRYIVDATPSRVGTVVPLETGTVDALCRDDDGCYVNLAMGNYDGAGTVASRSSRLFISQSGAGWRLDNDVTGPDGDGGVTEWSAWDCLLTDAESATDSNNGRRDGGWGLGLLNARGGYSDGATVCRVILED